MVALRAETDLAVPEPQPALDGRLVTTAVSEGVDEPRCCSLLRWMDGRRHAASPRPVHLRRLGDAMARLHNHADRWSPPDGFLRIRWDWETFFGDTMEYGGINAAAVWDLLPIDLRRMFDEVATQAGKAMEQLGTDSGTFGLIHADLHLDNTLFAGGEARPSTSTTAGSDIASMTSPWRSGSSDIAATTRPFATHWSRGTPRTASSRTSNSLSSTCSSRQGRSPSGSGSSEPRVNPRFRDNVDNELAAIRRSLDALGVSR